MEFHFEKNSGLTLDKSLSLEWLETNGLGGYASSNILNCHTRKYHGLLVSQLLDKPDKYALLSNLDEFISIDDTEYHLAINNFKNDLQAKAFEYFVSYHQKTHPVFTFRIGNTTITKELVMLNERDTIMVKYKVDSQKPVKLTIKPLLAYRNFHALTKENQSISKEPASCIGGIKISPYGSLPTLFLQLNNEHIFSRQPVWYKNFNYPIENERGFPGEEDLFSPGFFTTVIEPQNEVIFIASLEEFSPQSAIVNWHEEIVRRQKLPRKNKGNMLQRHLQKTLASFLKKDQVSKEYSITAGFHWFLEWGRDTMLSLPALIQSGYEKEALSILTHFAKNEKNGLIPNFLGETFEKNAYNTVDASLWFALAVWHYYAETKDTKSIEKHLWPTLKNIYSHYKNGTTHGIKMGEEGLIYAGCNDPNDNLTWMDAKIDGVPAVKRAGLIVEINALWYNMLCFMEILAKKFSDPIRNEIKPLLKQVKSVFRSAFWDDNLGYLRDYINPNNPLDPDGMALRPNQIIAVSIPYSPLSPKIMGKIVQAVRAHLLTPYGLRTLSPDNKNYIGEYSGNPRERDQAYHNGTAWPWLLGHFADALIKVLPKRSALKMLKPCIEVLTEHLSEGGIGTISEIFSGNKPHQPNGCISQAWSVAEFLRMTNTINYK